MVWGGGLTKNIWADYARLNNKKMTRDEILNRIAVEKHGRHFNEILAMKSRAEILQQALDEALEQGHNLPISDDVEPKGKLEMFQNMQYYMEHCQMKGYITPQDWLEREKHF